MLRRAKRLQTVCDEFCMQYSRHDLQLSQEEWRQVDYLLTITQPFYTFTTTLSKSKDITVHTIFGIYNKLFSHLEKSMAKLARKKVNWKTVMLSALKQAKLKLSQYYSMTDEIPGDLYAIGTILAPQNKLHFFSTRIGSHAGAYDTAKALRIALCPTNSNIQIHSLDPMVNIRLIRSLILICLSHQLQPSSHRWTPTMNLHDILEAVCYSP